jgi:hypothetical protein
MRKFLYVILFLISLNLNGFAQTYTISGYITDKDTRETLIGVTVLIKGTNRGITTDGNGFFRLSGIKPGEYTLQISYIGYKKQERVVNVINKSILLDETRMEQEAVSLNSIIIKGLRPDTIGDKEVETSQLKMSPKTILNVPSARGDVFRAIKYLPGIESTEPFSPLYSVRGSDPAGNLVLLDGVAIYNPYHFTTADGLFNIQTIKDVDILAGGFGAEFGGRNSSIMYITTKDGNMNKLHGEVEPTTTHSKVFLEFPVGKESSMMVAARYFYDIPSYFLFASSSYFYDFNISYTARINEKNRLTIKLFDSKDDLRYDPNRIFSYFDKSFNVDIYEDFHMKMKNNWSNRAITTYLKTVINPNVFLTTQVYGSFNSANNYSAFDFSFTPDSTINPIQLKYNTLFTTKIQDIAAKTSLNANLGQKNNLKVGIDYNNYYFNNSANIQEIDKGNSVRSPSLLAFYAEDKFHLWRFAIRPGMRISKYSYYNNWQYEPRLNMALNLPGDLKFKAAWGIYYQNIISMNTQEYEISQFLDYYYPLKDLAPSKSIHNIAGFEKTIFGNSLLSIDAYYIDMPRVYTFNMNLNELEARTFSDKLESGTGQSYGIEIKFKGQYKKLSGWLGYSLSKSTRSFPSIMNGKSFLFDFDRKHSLKVVANFEATDRLTYNSSLVLQSGLPKTLEATIQDYYFYDPQTNQLSEYPFYISGSKNNARLPMTIELDLGVMKKLRSGFGAELVEFLNAEESYFTLTIGNILFLRRNVLWYFPYGGKKYIPIGINYFPVLTAGYKIKF